jgi:uncharacterized membrane protein YfcA
LEASLAELMVFTFLTALTGIFLASVLRGFTGFGFGLAAVPLQVIVGAGGLRAAMHQTDWRSIRGLVPGVLVGIPLGLLILTAFLPNTVRLAIGLIIAASVVLLWRGARLPPRPSGVVTMAVGMLSGVISGLAAAVRATSIVYFMLSGLTSAAAMAYRGMIDQEILLWTLAAIPAAYGGNWIGTWAFHKAKPHHHRMTALIVLSMLAAVLIVRSLAAG